MKVVILAAGKSTRLLPMTKETHQCMLKFRSGTILDKQIEMLQKSRINKEDILVVTGYLSQGVEDFCLGLGIRTEFNPFYEVSGMAMSLWVIKKYLNDGFLLIYSDILFDDDTLIDNILGDKNHMCLVIKKHKLRDEAEKVEEVGGVIKSIGKLGLNKKNAEFVGVAKFSSIGANKLLKEIGIMAKDNIDISFINVMGSLVDQGEIVSSYDIAESKFIDIDFPYDLDMAKKMLFV